MPSPVTPRRTVKVRDSKTSPKRPKVDIGKPLGEFDNDSVRDRVRQWQAQGGGVVTASDIFVEYEEDDPPATKPSKATPKSTPKGSAKKEDPSEVTTANKRPGRRKDEEDEEPQRQRYRSISTPRKRVISDGHWRHNRSPPRSAEAAKAPSKGVIPDDGIRVRPLPDPELHTSKSGRRKDDDPPAKKIYTSFDDGIRVYSTPTAARSEHNRRRSSDHTQEGESEASFDGTSSSRVDSLPLRRQKHSLKSKESPSEQDSPSILLGDSAGKENARRRNSTHQDENTRDTSRRPTHGSFAKMRESQKSSKGNILSNLFSRGEKEPVPDLAPKISSVEAWLNQTTDDPFVEDFEALERPVDIPAPLRTSSPREKQHDKRREKPIPSVVSVEDPNKIWEELEKKDSVRSKDAGNHRHRRSRTLSGQTQDPLDGQEFLTSPRERSRAGDPETKSIHIEQNKPHFSPPSLQRRGAKKNASSPTKESRKSSPLKESFQPLMEESNSVVSSTITTSSVEPLKNPPPLRPPGLNIHRPFPSTGKHRLSTIASVETFNTVAGGAPKSLISGFSNTTAQPPIHSTDAELLFEARDQFDPDSLQRNASKSRITKHSDLMSVLSMPRSSGNSIRSARSIRTNRSRLATANIEDIMRELTTDESKYMRELRTLVDGVIPVLLTCVLSKSESATAAGLFGSTKPESDPAFTKPIVDMGISLERLKILHKRIPLDRPPEALLTWAQGEQMIYGEYINSWRMGFKDVVVNLASTSDDQKSDVSSIETSIDGGLPRNKDGDVVDSNGERVDVAYLLKRPLVRLKYLAKTFRAINFVKPSLEAENLAIKYQELVVEAKRRNNEEEARLEDEAAANIDPTRARDPQTLGPLNGVVIERSRRVRARDLFSLTLLHTSGQRMDCHVELFLRDDSGGHEKGGDILICEVDGTGRWLLFPPIQLHQISSRNGDVEGEIVVMIRGVGSAGQDWHELLSLCSENEQTSFEWVQLLGLIPIPPQIMRMQSFMRRSDRRKTLMAPPTSVREMERIDVVTTPIKSRTPSPREMEVPIGELAVGKNVKSWVAPLREATLPVSKARGEDSLPYNPTVSTIGDMGENQPGSRNTFSTPKDLNEAMSAAGTLSSALKRTKATRHSRQQSDSAVLSASPRGSPAQSDLSDPGMRSSSLMSPTHLRLPERHKEEASVSSRAHKSKPLLTRSSPPVLTNANSDSKELPSPKSTSKESTQRPSYHRSKPSAPTLDLPLIPKVRQHSPPVSPTQSSVDEPERVWQDDTTSNHAKSNRTQGEDDSHDQAPLPPAHKEGVSLTKESSRRKEVVGSSTSSRSHHKQTPSTDLRTGKRRSSSPLKHEYEPSSGSESGSESDASTVQHNDAYDDSESTDSEDIEGGDVATPLVPINAVERMTKLSANTSASHLALTTSSPTCSPDPSSDESGQARQERKAIASVSYWENTGSWKAVYPDECSIVITPGLIEVFEMSSAHSQTASKMAGGNPAILQPRPLIALELTPLVPIRKGTAIDISIRSPPTSESRFNTHGNNNIMFRSRSTEECDLLYSFIHNSRLNNPTYIALEGARNVNQFGGASFNRGGTSRSSRSSSWFGFIGRRKSYRASSAPTPSINHSESSVGTSASVFSALMRFRKGSSRFSIARSTVTSRDGSLATSRQTSASGGSGSSTPSSLNIKDGVAPLGLSNLKIRLYIRESLTKWNDLGSARLTIMLPTNAAHPPPPGSSSSDTTPGPEGNIGMGVGIGAGGAASRGDRRRPTDKRIIVVGKPKSNKDGSETVGETKLDVTLDESCFERVARTGIAVSVWEKSEGGRVANEGGVALGRTRVYMLQVSVTTTFILSVL